MKRLWSTTLTLATLSHVTGPGRGCESTSTSWPPFAKPKANRAHTAAKQYCSGKSHWTSASKDTKREGKSYWGPFFPHIPFMAGSKDLIYRCFRNHSWISAVWAGTECSLVLQQHIKHSCVSALQSRDTPGFSVVLKCFIVSWSLTMQSKQENTDSTTETQQQGNSMKFRATEDKRKFLKKLTWIIVYYLFTDIFKTYILLLHCLPEHSGAVPESPQIQREQRAEISSFPHKKNSFIFNMIFCWSFPWADSFWGQTSASGTWEVQSSTGRKIGAENDTTTLFQQHPAPKPEEGFSSIITTPWESQCMNLLAVDETHKWEIPGRTDHLEEGTLGKTWISLTAVHHPFSRS